MDAPFPFGLPLPTAFYLSIYVLTLIAHVAFMNYVLAGSAYLAVHAVLRRPTDAPSPLAEVLRDWMPFMLSAAITAGIAPLLFLQVLYQERFYTANLLLFHRWMAILPALIAGFYLCYLLKVKALGKRPLWMRSLIAIGAFACFAFVGWSWVENHLLSLDRAVWPRQYASGSLLFRSPELLPRLMLWFTAAFPTMALMVGWQLFALGNVAEKADPKQKATPQIPGSRRTAALAMAGLVASALSAAVYVNVMPSTAQDAITSTVAWPYLLCSIVGGAVQAAAWFMQYRETTLSRRWLIAATAGLALNFLGMAVVNESTRLASVDLTWLAAIHERAFEVGGFGVFVLFFAINFGLIGLSIQLVRRGLRQVPKAEPKREGQRKR